MKLVGKVFSGVARGEPLIELYSSRIKGLLKFEPFPGTLDLKLTSPVNLSMFERKTLEHVLLGGVHVKELHFIPAKIRDYDCWIMKQEHGIYHDDVIEIIAKDNIKTRLGIKDGDTVDVEVGE